jgi:GntR family transcriptional regulator
MIFDRNRPIYWQIIEYIKQKIMNQEIASGEMVPSVRALALELNVTTNTIQRAYMELVREQILIPQKGLGYKVTDEKRKISKLRNNYIEEKLDKLFEDMQNMGIKKTEFNKIIKSYIDELGEE